MNKGLALILLRGAAVYDLSPWASAYQRASIRPRQIGLAVFGGLGVVMLVAGAVLGGPRIGGVILVAGGISIVVAVLWGFRRLPRSADELMLSEQGLTFRLLDGSRRELRWSESNPKIRIYDWSSIPPTSRSKGLGQVEFIVAPALPVEAVVNRDCVLAILEQARRHGFTISGWEESPPSPGPARTIVLTAGPHPSRAI